MLRSHPWILVGEESAVQAVRAVATEAPLHFTSLAASQTVNTMVNDPPKANLERERTPVLLSKAKLQDCRSVAMWGADHDAAAVQASSCAELDAGNRVCDTCIVRYLQKSYSSRVCLVGSSYFR